MQTGSKLGPMAQSNLPLALTLPARCHLVQESPKQGRQEPNERVTDLRRLQLVDRRRAEVEPERLEAVILNRKRCAHIPNFRSRKSEIRAKGRGA